MKSRIPKLLKDEPRPASTSEERDRALRQACRAAGRLLADQAASGMPSEALDAPAPLPESSRRLIRRLAKQRRQRIAGERNA